MIEQLILLAILNNKELDIKDFYERKQMNEEMETELIQAYSRPDNLAVSEYSSVDEAVSIDIRK